MLANNNLKVCWTLAKRDFRFHRAKNCILALAVALVTGLYAFMFLLGAAPPATFSIPASPSIRRRCSPSIPMSKARCG